MRWAQYEVKLVGENDRSFEETTINGSTYVIANPGERYHVKITVFPDVNGNFPAKYLRFGLYVDGKDVQYWKRLDLSSPSNSPMTVRFWGFKQNLDDICSFVFSSIQSTDIGGTRADTQPLGAIRVVVFEAAIEGGVFNNLIGAKNLSLNTCITTNQKVADQASIATVMGSAISKDVEKFPANLTKWKNVSKFPMETIDLRYHTRAALNILQMASSNISSLGNKRSLPPDFSGNDSDQQRQKVAAEINDNEDDDVVAVPIVKHVPLIDLTDDDGHVREETLIIRK